MDQNKKLHHCNFEWGLFDWFWGVQSREFKSSHKLNWLKMHLGEWLESCLEGLDHQRPKRSKMRSGNGSQEFAWKKRKKINLWCAMLLCWCFARWFFFSFCLVLFSHGQQLRTSESLFSKQHSIKLSIHYCGTSFIFILPNNNKKNETYFPIFLLLRFVLGPEQQLLLFANVVNSPHTHTLSLRLVSFSLLFGWVTPGLSRLPFSLMVAIIAIFCEF